MTTRETREATERSKTWRPPTSLPDPSPRDGYKHRWVRMSTLGKDDSRNVATRYQDGFEPCRWSEYPEIAKMMNSGESKTGNIEIGGLILCRAPVEMVQQRNAHYTKVAADWMTSVDKNLMRENDPRMPLFNSRRTEVSFGKR